MSEREHSLFDASRSRHESSTSVTAHGGGESTSTSAATHDRRVRLFPFQVSGHSLMFRTTKNRIIKLASSREIRFYERAVRFSPQILQFVAKFYGYVNLDVPAAFESVRAEQEKYAEQRASPWSLYLLRGSFQRMHNRKPGSEFVVLKDFTAGLSKPSILDVKLGTLHHSIDRAVRKPTRYATAVTLGFCVGGMLLWDSDKEAYTHVSKFEGRALTEQTIDPVLDRFFADTGKDRPRHRSLAIVIGELCKLLDFMLTQETWRFHSTSLLLIYEAAESRDAHATVRLVDFAHAYMNHPGEAGRQPQRDTGCILGIANLLWRLCGIERRYASARRRISANSTSTSDLQALDGGVAISEAAAMAVGALRSIGADTPTFGGGGAGGGGGSSGGASLISSGDTVGPSPPLSAASGGVAGGGGGRSRSKSPGRGRSLSPSRRNVRSSHQTADDHHHQAQLQSPVPRNAMKKVGSHGAIVELGEIFSSSGIDADGNEYNIVASRLMSVEERRSPPLGTGGAVAPPRRPGSAQSGGASGTKRNANRSVTK